MQRKRIGSIVRWALIGVGGLIAIVVAAVLLIPVDSYRGPIEQAADAATGRTLHLRGPLGFTLYPEIGISASDVTFSNAPGARDPEMATIGRMIVGVKLIPLFSRRVEVTRVLLEKPVIHLEVAKDGTGNWALASAKPAAPQSGGGGAAAANLSLSNLRVQDGTFTYYDARTGKGQSLDQVDVSIDTTSLDQPFSISGGANYKGHRVEIAGKLGNLGDALAQKATPASFSVTSDVMKMTLDGTIGGKTTASGKLHLEMPSLRQFANWLEVSVPAGKGFGTMALDATVTVSPQIFSATAVKLGLDGMNVTGDLALRTGGPRPAIAGKLAVDRLDVNTYMPAQTAGSDQNAASAPSASGWSSTPISFDVLKMMDADLGLNVGQLLIRNLQVQKGQLQVSLKNGVLNTDLQNIVLYQGTGKGSLTVDASKATPTIRDTLSATGLQVQPFLTSFMGVDRITGTGNVSFDVTAQGASPKAIIASLGGKGEIAFRDGMIKGVDLAAVARTIQSALTGAAVGERASTDFAELGGTFTINKGVMTNNDFHLLNPFVRISGNGTVDLANRNLDFHLEPKLVATTQGQGGQAGLAGIGIPFRVSGPWTKLSYGPDMKNVGKALTGTLIDTLTGTKKDGQTGAQSKPNVGNVLKGLFGR
jgi:AsmA protein